MKISFWGVRGSVCSSGPKTQQFGGHTSCIEVTEKNHRIILDAGTGLRALGLKMMKKESAEDISIFVTHCHLDHIIGLPFFKPLHHPKKNIRLYGPVNQRRSFQDVIASIFSKETFPVSFNDIPATLIFKELYRETIQVGPFSVTSFPINHPGSTLGYIISNGKKSVAYLPDHEPIEGHNHFPSSLKNKGQDFDEEYSSQLKALLKNCDMLIHDAFFTDSHYEKFHGWGHSPLSYPIQLAKESGVKKLVFFHYAPETQDRELKTQRDWALKKIKKQKINTDLILSREGLTIQL